MRATVSVDVIYKRSAGFSSAGLSEIRLAKRRASAQHGPRVSVFQSRCA